MTEAQWQAATDPEAMLKLVRPTAPKRKLRLFACACVRHLWAHLDHPRCREAVEVAERVADGLVERLVWDRARGAARAVARSIRWPTEEGWWAAAPRYYLRAAARAAIQRNIRETVMEAFRYTASAAAERARHEAGEPGGAGRTRVWQRAWTATSAVLRLYLRDVLGNPGVAPPPVSPAVLAWDDGTVRRFAEAIYQERAFERMPILADALEDAGCSDADLLGHCRGPGPHARGCWALDALRGLSPAAAGA